MALFDNIKGKQGRRAGQWFEPGSYDVEVNRVEFREGFKGTFWIAEVTVLRGTNANTRAGERRSWLCKMPPEMKELIAAREAGDVKRVAQLEPYEEMFLGNVNSFVLAGMNSLLVEKGETDLMGAEDVDKEIVLQACGENNILAGAILHVDVIQTKTAKGGDFSAHNWSTPRAEQVAELRELARAVARGDYAAATQPRSEQTAPAA